MTANDTESALVLEIERIRGEYLDLLLTLRESERQARSELDSARAERRSSESRLERVIADEREARSLVTQDLLATRASVSWRLTRPLRMGKTGLSRIRQGRNPFTR